MIKIFFQDPTEKPVSLYHHLRLYGAEDTVVDGKSVIAEHYDEIVGTFFSISFASGKLTVACAPPL